MGFFDRFKNISPSSYRLRLLAVIVAILVVPLVVYYVLIVRSQTAYFTERSFRRLSLIASQINSKVESVGTVVANTSEKFINPKESSADKFDPTSDKNAENLKSIFAGLKEDNFQLALLGVDVVSGDSKQTPGTVVLTSVKQEGEAPKLDLTYISKPTKDNNLVRVRVRADLQGLFQPLLNSRTQFAGAERDQFQNVLISEAGTGKVIFQLDTTELRLASLAGLAKAGDNNKPIEVKEINQQSSIVDVSLAGSQYKLFSHPIEIPLVNSDGSNASWIVSGLIDSDSFQKEVWSISYTILICCAFVTALLILSWPFLKLVLIGPKDRLGTADVYFLTFAIVVTLGLLTSLALYAYSYTRLEYEFKDELQKLATKVKLNFKEELTDALLQLDKLGNNCNLLKKLDAEAKCTPQGSTSDIYHSDETDKAGILPTILKPEAATTYPYFESAVWIDNNGTQKAKWTVKKETTQYIDVSGRDYFNKLKNAESYQFDNHRFWLEPIVSKTTGRNEVEISQLAVDPKWIAAFDTRLISLMQPVLPAGFGYVIIGNDGKVLFHSDETHHLGENFYQECDNDPSLRSAVISRSDVPLNLTYVGEGHAVLVTTIDGFPNWSLIVFRNKQPLRSAYLELLTLVSLLFFLYAIVILLCFSGFYLINVRDERRAWLWPYRQRRPVYYQSFLMLLALSAISSLLIRVLHDQWLVFVAAGLGLVSAVVFFLNLRFGAGNLWPRRFSAFVSNKWWGRYDLAYALNLTFLLLLIAILPAVAFFKYAFESEANVFIKHGQFTFALELAKREQRIRAQYANIKPQSESEIEKSDFITKRSAVEWDVYDQFFFNSTHEKPDDSKCAKQRPVELLAQLNTFVPLYNQVSVERRGLLLTSVANGFCKWESGQTGQTILHLDSSAVGEAAGKWRHLETVVPPLGRPGPLWIGAFVLAFIPFFLFVHFIVRKVFLLDIYKPSTRPLRTILSEKIDRNLFVVVDAPFVTKAPCQGSNLCLNDFRTIANSPNWEDNLVLPSFSEKAVYAFDNFDYQSDDPKTNQQKLKLLERLLAEKKTLLIFSAVDPAQYSFRDVASRNGEIEESGRWARVMSQFFTEYAEDTGDPQDFSDRIEKERARLLADGASSRSNAELNELIDTLRDECIPKGPLQQIGLQIVAQPSFVTLSRDHLLNRIVNQARPYYDHLWNSCSVPERLTLFHLAKDRLLSHRDPDIERLLRRELIVRQADIHLFNDSFRQFIKSTENSAFVAAEESKAKQVSLWHTLKVPLLVVLVAITIFLFVTQRDLYTSALAIVTAVTTIIPAFFKVLTIFHSDPVARAPEQR